MFNLPIFNDYFLYGRYKGEIRADGRVAQAYAKTIKMIRSSSSSCINPSELKS